MTPPTTTAKEDESNSLSETEPTEGALVSAADETGQQDDEQLQVELGGNSAHSVAKNILNTATTTPGAVSSSSSVLSVGVGASSSGRGLAKGRIRKDTSVDTEVDHSTALGTTPGSEAMPAGTDTAVMKKRGLRKQHLKLSSTTTTASAESPTAAPSRDATANPPQVATTTEEVLEVDDSMPEKLRGAESSIAKHVMRVVTTSHEVDVGNLKPSEDDKQQQQGEETVTAQQGATELGLPDRMQMTAMPGANRFGPPSQEFGAASADRFSSHLSLVEAQQVDLMQAQEIDPFELERQQQRKKGKEKKHWFLCCGGAILVLALVIILAVIFGRSSSSDNKSEDVPTVAPVPTPAPSNAPSDIPTMAPTGSLDLLLQRLPDYTVESMENKTSPQRSAYNWLLDHPDLPIMAEFRKTQLFALACFYYAMDGPEWPSYVKERWLQHDESECLWFSNAFGEYNPKTGEFEQVDFWNTTICNNQGEFQLLDLVGLELKDNPGVHVPPEMSLLTALIHLVLPKNDVQGSLSNFLPSELYSMGNLTQINLHSNSLTGTVPTEVGQLTSLYRLHYYNNLLTGTIPTQVGFLTGMDWLTFHANQMIGTLPTELGLLTDMVLLTASYNDFTGTIPEELASLTSLVSIFLANNSLTGTIPEAFEGMYALEQGWGAMTLTGNDFTGTIPEELCSLGLYTLSMNIGITFDCNEDKLCGCCWCACPNTTAMNCSSGFDPTIDDEGWPGTFPPADTSVNNAVTFNVRTDFFPHEFTWEWQLKITDDFWEVLSFYDPFDANALLSYTKEVEPMNFYRVSMNDFWGNGLCCSGGFGWFTITNSTPSPDNINGTIVWQARGDVLQSNLTITLWADEAGNVQLVEQ